MHQNTPCTCQVSIFATQGIPSGSSGFLGSDPVILVAFSITRPTTPGLMVKSPAAVPVKSALVEVDGKDSRKDASAISQVFEEQTSKSQGI